MPPAIATIVCVLGIAALFWLDRDQKARTSIALWLPVVWFLLACSRNVSQWFEISAPIASFDQVEQIMDGNPVDRLVYTVLLAIGLIILVTRYWRVGRVLRANWAILLFFFYAAVSLLWSDFPFVGFKRWTRTLTDLVMILIVLTDREPLTAFKRLLARLAYVLIPLSILFIKYYHDLGVQYNFWTGQTVFTGVTSNKNTLGAICLCLGLGVLWRFVDAYKNQEVTGRMRRMIANGIILAMVLWIFLRVDSMTPLSCLLMAGILLLVANSRVAVRSRVLVHLLMAAMLAVSIAVLFFKIDPEVLYTMGRNPTLTERTELWRQLLSFDRNPLLGTGFGNYWLGPRLSEIWRLNTWQPNEAHNGYLEIYLNLGWVGVVLLMVVIAAAYRTVLAAWRSNTSTGSLSLAYFFTGLVFNFTEAAFFKMQAVIWLFFLLAIVKAPARSTDKAGQSGQSLFEHTDAADREQVQPALTEEVV
jgi:exopolysaccharide production protein ExoQ